MRADWYAQGIDAAEEVLPGIKNDLLLGKIDEGQNAIQLLLTDHLQWDGDQIGVDIVVDRLRAQDVRQRPA